MTEYTPKPISVQAMQFDGSYSTGIDIVNALKDSGLELIYDYGRTRFKLRGLFGSRYVDVQAGDYVVKGALGELFFYRENLFLEMFSPVYREP